MLAAYLPLSQSTNSTSRTISTARPQIQLIDKTSIIQTKPQRQSKKKGKQQEPEYKSRDLISSGFIKFLDEPSAANPQVITLLSETVHKIILEPDAAKSPDKQIADQSLIATTATATTPFFHTAEELPKIRQQNMKNYSDLTNYPRATDARVAEYFPQLDQIIQAECAKVGIYIYDFTFFDLAGEIEFRAIIRGAII